MNLNIIGKVVKNTGRKVESQTTSLNSTGPFSQITWNKGPSISQHTKERMSHVTLEITLENESDISKSIQFGWWTNTAGSTPITKILKAGHSFNSIENPQTQNGHLCSIYNYLYITKNVLFYPLIIFTITCLIAHSSSSLIL